MHMQRVSRGRPLGDVVASLLCLLFAVFAPSEADGAASVFDEDADLNYGLVNAQSYTTTMDSPSMKTTQGIASGNWGLAIEGNSLPIDMKIKAVKYHETCADAQESTFSLGSNEAMVTGTVGGNSTAYFQGMSASQAGAYKICVTNGTGWSGTPKKVGIARVRGHVGIPDETNFQKTTSLTTKFISDGPVECCLSISSLRRATSEEIQACQNRHGDKPDMQNASNNNELAFTVENVVSGTKVYFACTQPATKAIANGGYTVSNGYLRTNWNGGSTNEHQFIPGFYKGYQYYQHGLYETLKDKVYFRIAFYTNVDFKCCLQPVGLSALNTTDAIYDNCPTEQGAVLSGTLSARGNKYYGSKYNSNFIHSIDGLVEGTTYNAYCGQRSGNKGSAPQTISNFLNSTGDEPGEEGWAVMNGVATRGQFVTSGCAQQPTMSDITTTSVKIATKWGIGSDQTRCCVTKEDVTFDDAADVLTCEEAPDGAVIPATGTSVTRAAAAFEVVVSGLKENTQYYVTCAQAKPFSDSQYAKGYLSNKVAFTTAGVTVDPSLDSMTGSSFDVGVTFRYDDADTRCCATSPPITSKMPSALWIKLCNGAFEDTGITAAGTPEAARASTGGVKFSSSITGLIPGNIYNVYCAQATTGAVGNGTMETAGATTPVTIFQAVNGDFEATVTFNVADDNTKCCAYEKTGGSEVACSTPAKSLANTPFESNITGLVAGTTYDFGCVQDGEDDSFGSGDDVKSSTTEGKACGDLSQIPKVSEVAGSALETSVSTEVTFAGNADTTRCCIRTITKDIYDAGESSGSTCNASVAAVINCADGVNGYTVPASAKSLANDPFKVEFAGLPEDGEYFSVVCAQQETSIVAKPVFLRTSKSGMNEDFPVTNSEASVFASFSLTDNNGVHCCARKSTGPNFDQDPWNTKEEVLACNAQDAVISNVSPNYETAFSIFKANFTGLSVATNYHARCATSKQMSQSLLFTTVINIEVTAVTETSLSVSTGFTLDGDANSTRCCITANGTDPETTVNGIIACHSAPVGANVPAATESSGGIAFITTFTELRQDTEYKVNCAQTGSGSGQKSPIATKKTRQSSVKHNEVTQTKGVVRASFSKIGNVRCCARKRTGVNFDVDPWASVTADDTKSVLGCNQTGDFAGKDKTAYGTPYAVISDTFDGLNTATNYMVRCATENEISEALPFTTGMIIEVSRVGEDSFVVSTTFALSDDKTRCCITEENQEEDNVAAILTCNNAPVDVNVPVAKKSLGGQLFKTTFTGLKHSTGYSVNCAQDDSNAKSPSVTLDTTMSAVVKDSVTESTGSVKASFQRVEVGKTYVTCCMRPRFGESFDEDPWANVNSEDILNCGRNTSDIQSDVRNASYENQYEEVTAAFTGLKAATNYVARCATEYHVSDPLPFTTKQIIKIVGYSETSLEALTTFTVGGSARCCIMEESKAETDVLGIMACASAPAGVHVPVATGVTGGVVFKTMFEGLTPNTSYAVTCAQSITNKTSPTGIRTTTMSGLDTTGSITDTEVSVKATFYQADNTIARCCVRKVTSPEFSDASEVMECADVDGAPDSPASTNYGEAFDATTVKFTGLEPGTAYVARCAQTGDDGSVVPESRWSTPIEFDTQSVVTTSKITERTIVATTVFAVNSTDARCCVYTPGSEPKIASDVSCPSPSSAATNESIATVVGSTSAYASKIYKVSFSKLTPNTEYTVVCASAAVSVMSAGAMSLVSDIVRTTESTILSNTVSEATFSVSARFSAASSRAVCCAREVVDAHTSPFPPAQSESATQSVLACGSNDGDIVSTQGTAITYSTAYSLARFDFGYPQLRPKMSYEVLCAAKDVYGTSTALKVTTQEAPRGSGTVLFHLILWGQSFTRELSLPDNAAIKNYFASTSGFFAQGIRPWHIQLSMYSNVGPQSPAIVTVMFPALTENIRAAVQTKIDKMRDDKSKSLSGTASVFEGLVPILTQLSGGKILDLTRISFYDEPLPTPPPLAQTETSVNVEMGVSIPGMHEDTTLDQVRAAIAAWFGVNIEDIVDVDLSFVKIDSNLAGRLLSSSTPPAFASVRFTLRSMNQRDANTKKEMWQTLSMNATTPAENQLIDGFFQDLRDQGVRASNTSVVIPIGRTLLSQELVQEFAQEDFDASLPIVVKPNITALIIANSNCSTVNNDYKLADLAQERANEARIIALNSAARCGLVPSPSSHTLDETDSDASAEVGGLSSGGFIGIMFGMAFVLGLLAILYILLIHRKHAQNQENLEKKAEMVVQYQNPNRV